MKKTITVGLLFVLFSLPISTQAFTFSDYIGVFSTFQKILNEFANLLNKNNLAQVISSSVTPSIRFEPDQYSSTSALLGATGRWDPYSLNDSAPFIAVEDISVPGNVTLESSGGYGGRSKFMRYNFPANPNQGEVTIGRMIGFNNLDSSNDVWIEASVRLGSNFEAAFSGNTNLAPVSAYKFLFLTFPGTGRFQQTLVYNPTTAVLGDANIEDRGLFGYPNIMDGKWHVVRWHAKRHPTNGVNEIEIDGKSVYSFQGNTGQADGTRWYGLAIGRNSNRGWSQNTSLDIGHVAVYTNNPNWGGSAITAPTPSAVTTPAPTVTFSASPPSITSGQSTTLSWSSTNATGCTASGGWSGSKATSGNQTLSPTSNTTYSLSCSGTGGSASQTATVNVSAVTTPTQTPTTVTPTTSIPGVPGAPQFSVASLGSSASSVKVDWAASFGASSYRYASGLNTSGNWNGQNGSVVSNSVTLTSVPNGSSIWFCVWASNSAGESPDYSCNSYTLQNTIAVPTTPVVTAPVPTQIPPSSKFSIGQQVQTTSAVNVRSSAGTSATALGSQTTGAIGTILGGGSYIDGYYWWNINYNAGVDGWSVEDYLQKYTAPIPTVVTPSVTTVLPGVPGSPQFSIVSQDANNSNVNVTWISSFGATSYRYTSGLNNIGSWNGQNGSVVSNSVTLTSVPNGSSIWFCVWASNSAGESPDYSCNSYLIPISTAVAPVVPTLTFSASPTSVTSGQSSVVSWSSTNATSCTASDGLQSGALATSGSVLTTPTQTSTYLMTCSGAGGSVSKSLTITVTPTTNLAPVTAPVSVPAPTVVNFAIGDMVIATSKINVRTDAGYSLRIGTQYKNSIGTITSGPTIKDGYVWWKVDFQTGVDGWVAQNYISKTSSLPVSTTSSTQSIQTQTTANTNISVGSNVTTTDWLNVRREPSTSSSRLGWQTPDSSGIVLEGPRLSGGYTWWRVDFASGTDGWVVSNYLR